MIFLQLFLVGIIENFLLSLHTKLLQKNRRLLCWIISFINILIWFYVISKLIENLHNIWIILIYAIGFASGDLLAIQFDKKLELLAKMRGVKYRKKKKRSKKK